MKGYLYSQKAKIKQTSEANIKLVVVTQFVDHLILCVFVLAMLPLKINHSLSL